jgi:glucose-6-phosphate 1-epimerase
MFDKTDTKLTLSLEKYGSRVEVLFFGATVTSWISPSPSESTATERLFLSKKSALDGSKPVRGGIPVVFPFFGSSDRPEHSKLSSHGFARGVNWSWGGLAQNNDECMSARLVLESTPEIKANYEPEFSLVYIVTLRRYSLTTELQVTNPSTSAPLVFQALLHNYFAADSATAGVSPLKGLEYIDKVNNFAVSTETRDVVDVKNFTDSVYKNAPGKYQLRWNNGGLNLETHGFDDVVVWNPQKEAGSKLGDMEDGGWERYICVEPGSVASWKTLPPKQTWSAVETMSVDV